MSNTATVEATVRTEFGKGASRRARRDGLVPAVLYGHGSDPQHFVFPAKEFARVLRAHGTNAVVQINADGQEHLAITKVVIVHPTKSYLQHIDLQVIRRGERITVEIPVTLSGTAASGSNVQHEATTLLVEADVLTIPEQLEVSIEGLEIGSKILAADLVLPEGVALAADPEQLVVQINEVREAELESSEDADESVEETDAEATVESSEES